MIEQVEQCNIAAYEQRIRECLVIDETSNTGLRWNLNALSRVRGKPAGANGSRGYWCVKISVGGVQKSFLAHRIIWFMTAGCWPSEQIDHVNGNKMDNRIANLREASPSDNSRNVGMPNRNTSGIKGVHFHKKSNKWRARLRCDGKNIHLGLFASIYDAERAVRAARNRLHGEFANHDRK